MFNDMAAWIADSLQWPGQLACTECSAAPCYAELWLHCLPGLPPEQMHEAPSRSGRAY